LNDKIRLITRRENVELTPSASDLFTNEIIAFKRRELDSTQHKEVREYEQAQILKVIDTEKTYCNSIDGLNVTIMPKYDTVRIEFNPNKIQSKKPTELLTYQELQDTFGIIEARLHEQGIKTDISQAQIKAFHNSFDVATNKPYKAYKPILVQSMTNRIIPQGRPRFEKDTFYCGNKTNEITAYNKTAEYLHHSGNPLGFECLRFEYRHNKIEKLYRHSPKSLTADEYIKARKEDHEAITAQIFGIDFYTTASALGLCNYLIDEYFKASDIIKALASQAIRNEVSNIGIGLNEALVNYARTDSRWQNRYRVVRNLEAFAQADSDEVLEAYYELKNKFKAVA